ncbi:uncharacterized protein PHALS_05452 [Plasmopara halstedii]|uniref:Uncharacterized protein n=1 Tax=Plasmopara halstedii TaxID=4781 RepID=A0A0P1B187_PLAHL|nr:uncharacterized protein PHALS_05452 [Plasmopara halstedii]CEG47968.1 hypothetical protein PHALS_05452 [Plasmopara halstedii]|eukprot:XP_024584337.1 hypothetical protein PHALS_05452 [Plasmopara halstedii]
MGDHTNDQLSKNIIYQDHRSSRIEFSPSSKAVRAVQLNAKLLSPLEMHALRQREYSVVGFAWPSQEDAITSDITRSLSQQDGFAEYAIMVDVDDVPIKKYMGY